MKDQRGGNAWHHPEPDSTVDLKIIKTDSKLPEYSLKWISHQSFISVNLGIDFINF